MKRLLLIMNPYAGQRKAQRHLAQIVEMFNRADFEVITYMTACQGDARNVVQRYVDSVDLVVCCGDMPLLKRATYARLCEHHRDTGAACTALSGTSDVYLPYGRILRDGEGRFLRVVEDRDCTAEQKEITELNSGVYVFDAQKLKEMLSRLGRDNAQGEYYLTDVPELMLQRGLKVDVCCQQLGMQIIGVNTPEQLNTVEEIINSEK